VDLGLRNRRAIVTGGSRGIGRAIARGLALEGVDLVIVGRDEAALAHTAVEIAEESGRTIRHCVCDISSTEQVYGMVDTAVELLGAIDILVNSAAQPAVAAQAATLESLDDEAFWSDVDVKVAGTLRVIRAVAPHMTRQGGGRIVSVSGLAARTTGSTIGSIRNVGVAALTKTLADELAPKGIRLISVYPGFTRTERTPDVIAARAEAAGVTPHEIIRRLSSANLLGRLVEASEVADAVVFLTSPRAIAINGDAIPLGGGIPGVIYY